MATIQGVYVALFGRPADPAGLAYFDGITNGGKDLAKIGVLSGQAEFTTRFAGQSNAQIITTIYQSLFGRAPEAAGLEFFANALNKGTLSINNIAIAILDGAQGDDKATVTNKLTAADAFTKALDTATEQAAYTGNNAAAAGRAFLTGVTKDPATVPSAAATDAAVAAVVGTPGGTDPGTGVVLDLGTAAISTNAANPANKSTNANDTINATHATLVAASEIDAGLGVDTLVYKLGAAVAAGFAPAKIAGVEKIAITAGPTFALADLQLTNATGVTEILNDASKAAIKVSDITLGTGLALKGAITGDTTFAYKAASVTGNSDAASVTLRGADIALNKITVADIETLNLTVDGTSSVKAFVAASATSVVVTGTGDLTIGGANSDLKKVAKFDASALNGKLTLDLATVDSTVAVTVTGTKFADSITLSDFAVLKDTVVYNAANKSTYGVLDTVNNFVSGEDKIDLKAFASTATGLKTTVTGFTNLQDGQSFLGNAVAYDSTSGTLVADVNGDGVFNQATDFAVKLGVVSVAAADIIWA